MEPLRFGFYLTLPLGPYPCPKYVSLATPPYADVDFRKVEERRNAKRGYGVAENNERGRGGK